MAVGSKESGSTAGDDLTGTVPATWAKADPWRAAGTRHEVVRARDGRQRRGNARTFDTGTTAGAALPARRRSHSHMLSVSAGTGLLR